MAIANFIVSIILCIGLFLVYQNQAMSNDKHELRSLRQQITELNKQVLEHLDSQNILLAQAKDSLSQIGKSEVELSRSLDKFESLNDNGHRATESLRNHLSNLAEKIKEYRAVCQQSISIAKGKLSS